MSPVSRAAAAILVAALAAGCDRLGVTKSPFKAIDVTGAPLGGELRLTDHNGKARSLADFRGKVVLVNFGYTQCPDVCPTTLADLASAMKKLGPDAARVQVLFVTVDPKRDKPELLREYLPAFDKSFLGLYGDADATKKVEGEFRIYAAERPGKTPDTYTVDHAAQTFVFDRQGKLRLVMGYGMAPEAIASDVRILLNS
ncbi:MAG TPA: SCO family protein [Usitatibacter sp.]|nr:SCO family protein [Usitatibacter sp.]